VLREKGDNQFSAFKQALIELAVAKLAPIAAEKRRLEVDHAYIDGVLADGAARARALAGPIYGEVKKIVGFITPLSSPL
jgi:tryptophanyl-tRNA synthetase